MPNCNSASNKTEKKSQKCKFQDKGICLRTMFCVYFHPEEVCNREGCKEDDCMKRHPKTCLYFFVDKKCRFKEKCMFKHISNNDDQIQKFKEQIEEPKNEMRKNDRENLKIINKKNDEIAMLKKERECLKVILNEKDDLINSNKIIIENLKHENTSIKGILSQKERKNSGETKSNHKKS